MFCVALIFNDLLVYGLSQGKGQLKIILDAQPVPEVLSDANVHDSIKDKLQFIQEIRKYAFDSLGITPNENYTTYYEQHGKPLLWVLTAADPYKMKAYEWRFPVVGRVGYKGYFDRSRAYIEEADLRLQGLDTDVGQVGGWSTLGYFKDPVLSQMLRNSKGMLAELIIHELTHGTIYVKSNVTFNENLASFIGEQGAIRFLSLAFGDSSTELKSYLREKRDEKLFSETALRYASQLDSLYKVHPDSSAGRAKREIILSFVSEIKDYPFQNRRFKTYAMKSLRAGNAFFLSFIRYESKLGDFQTELDSLHKGNLHAYLASLKLKYGID